MPPCGVPVMVSLDLAFLGHDARLQEGLDQGQDALVPDAPAHPVQNRGVCSSSKHAVMSASNTQ